MAALLKWNDVIVLKETSSLVNYHLIRAQIMVFTCSKEDSRKALEIAIPG